MARVKVTRLRLIPRSTIIRAVEEVFSRSKGELIGPSRAREIAYPRQALMFLLYRYTRLSTPGVGKQIGNRDHTTVLHGVTNVRKLLRTNQTFKNSFVQIMKKLEPFLRKD